MLEKNVSTLFHPFLGRKSIGYVIFQLFSDKNLDKSHGKSFEKLMEVGRKVFNKGINIGSVPKKFSSTKWNRYYENLRQ
jgi:hypothetical protein